MKRTLALILAFCLLGSLCACGSNNEGTTPTETTNSTEGTTPTEATKPTEDTTSTESTKPVEIANVVEPLTWKKINALPIAKNSMSEEELRQLCLDFMDMMMLFTWTPSVKTDLINKGKVVKTFEPGKVYGGTPYLTAKCGNIYTAMEYYNEENGMLDLSGGMDTLNLIGNQCSSSTFWAWSRVCASAEHATTANMIEAYGCLRVGPYTYRDDIDGSNQGFYAEGCGTDIICAENGTQTMFESYALMKPADGIVSSTQGHVCMIASTPNVVRDANGKIDGMKSTVTYTDQDGKYYPTAQADGSPYEHVGGNKVQISFYSLYYKQYIPFTFAELNKDKPVEKSKTTMDYTGKTINLHQLSLAKISSNYSISDITVVIKDKKGNQVFRKLTPMYDNFPTHKVVNVGTAATSLDLAEFADGKHTIEISARIGTGEKPVVYTGKLVS